MDKKQLERISELTRLSRERELTAAEQEERQQLRAAYLAAIRADMTATLNNVSIAEPDGTVRPLKPKGSKSLQ